MQAGKLHISEVKDKNLPAGMEDGDEADVEGLADYDADAAELPEALLSSAAAYSGAGALSREPDPAVLENLKGLHRLLVARHLATLQEWLRILVKVSNPPFPQAIMSSLQHTLVLACIGHCSMQ